MVYHRWRYLRPRITVIAAILLGFSSVLAYGETFQHGLFSATWEAPLERVADPSGQAELVLRTSASVDPTHFPTINIIRTPRERSSKSGLEIVAESYRALGLQRLEVLPASPTKGLVSVIARYENNQQLMSSVVTIVPVDTTSSIVITTLGRRDQEPLVLATNATFLSSLAIQSTASPTPPLIRPFLPMWAVLGIMAGMAALIVVLLLKSRVDTPRAGT